MHHHFPKPAPFSMPNSSGSSAARDSCSKSTIVAEIETGSHVLEVAGYSGTKDLGVRKRIDSGVFSVAGHRWFVAYYPDGLDEESANYISVFVHIDRPVAKADVKARFGFSLLNHGGEPVPKYTFRGDKPHTFSISSPSWGYHKFIERKVLESSYLKDDSFQIMCDLTVLKGIRTETPGTKEPRPTPPLDLQRHLGDLLAGNVGGDVTFEVDGEVFTAHRYVLAARSSVFMAEFFGPMKVKATDHICINDMEARVFKSMLHFIYTDSMPVTDECDRTVLCQHLLVAADRYDLHRLKLICEDMLSSSVDVSTAATTLVLAEQHGCQGLKDACFKFLKGAGNTKTVMASDGFLHLKNSCPSLLEELLEKIAP